MIELNPVVRLLFWMNYEINFLCGFIARKCRSFYRRCQDVNRIHAQITLINVMAIRSWEGFAES